MQKTYHFEFFYQRSFVFESRFLVSNTHRDSTLAFHRFFEKTDLVFSHFLIQSRMVNAKEFGCVFLVAIEPAQHLEQYGPLQGIYEIFQLDPFSHVEVLDKKVKKSVKKFCLIPFSLMRKTPRTLFEES